MISLLATASCGVNQEGRCHGEDVFAVVLIALLVVAIAVAIMGWVWVRWERGPFWIVMRVLTNTREKRQRRD